MEITGYTLCDCPHGKLLEYQIVTGLNATFRPDDLPDCEKCGREGKIPNVQEPNTNADTIGATVAPARYSTTDRETIDRIRDLLGTRGFLAYCRGQVVRYLDRAGHKGPKEEDEAKAEWYMQMALHVADPVNYGDPRVYREGFQRYEPQPYPDGLYGLAPIEDDKHYKSLGTIMEECHASSRSKGWWDDCKFLNPKADSTSGNGLDQHLVKKTIPEKLALIHSEVSEALEDYRVKAMPELPDRIDDFGGIHCPKCKCVYGFDNKDWNCPECGQMAKPTGFPTELADIVIRVFDLAGALNIDLEEVILRKMAYNETRPYRHGGKTC